MRVFAIVNNLQDQEEERFEVLDSNFKPTPDAIVILKNGNKIVKAVVTKVENVLERNGNNADFIYNVFVKILQDAN